MFLITWCINKKTEDNSLMLQSEELDLTFTDYFFSNIVYVINKVGYSYSYFGMPNIGILEFYIPPCVKDPLDIQLIDVLRYTSNFWIGVEYGKVRVALNLIIRRPELYNIVTLQVQASALFDLKMLLGMKATWPYPSIMPILSELKINKIYLTLW